MIWIIVIAIIGFILFRFFYDFFSERKKDNDELQVQTIEEKFSVIVSKINEAAFNGKGKVVDRVPKFFNLYEEGQNQIVTFLYGTGHLTITWRYKYFENEVVHQRQFNNVRNINISDQQKMAERMVSEMSIVVENHKIKVTEAMFNHKIE